MAEMLLQQEDATSGKVVSRHHRRMNNTSYGERLRSTDERPISRRSSAKEYFVIAGPTLSATLNQKFGRILLHKAGNSSVIDLILLPHSSTRNRDQLHERAATSMNDLYSPTNGIRSDERSLKDDERPHSAASAITTGLRIGPKAPRRAEMRKATVAIILAFWVFYFLGTSIVVFTMSPDELDTMYAPRAIVAASGVGVSFIMVWVQGLLRHSSLSRRALVALALSALGAAVHLGFNLVIFGQFNPRQWETPLAGFIQDYMFRLWIFGTLSGMILALSYAADIREREERIHALQALAHSAHIRALRNQLNPHFLFNALNSIVSLISRRRGGEAEVMTENLADFLRTTLALDPEKIVPLIEEVRLQELYLSIEKVRFPDRLQIHFDIPDELGSAEIPALITQPLIENSIKYAVARSTRPVRLRIQATSEEDRLRLIIEDDGGDASNQPAKGARMGLSNVTERLSAHYGELATLEAHPKDGGGFVNILTIPWRRAE